MAATLCKACNLWYDSDKYKRECPHEPAKPKEEILRLPSYDSEARREILKSRTEKSNS